MLCKDRKGRRGEEKRRTEGRREDGEAMSILMWLLNIPKKRLDLV